jgi:hypothetical protein
MGIPAAHLSLAKSITLHRDGSTAPMTAGWAFQRLYLSESARRKALPAWLHEYDHHRLHTPIGKTTPISRLTNLPGH